jgi:hypothetical protein
VPVSRVEWAFGRHREMSLESISRRRLKQPSSTPIGHSGDTSSNEEFRPPFQLEITVAAPP